jgi:hypothetical protein
MVDNVQKDNNIIKKVEEHYRYLLAVFFHTKPVLIHGMSLSYGNTANRKVAQNPVLNIRQSKVSRTQRNNINSF